MKVIKGIGKGLAVILAVIVLFLAVSAIINAICIKREEKKIVPYGKLVPVAGKQMNVVISGQGEETVVILPGHGTSSPGLDFSPLVKELAPYYRVVVVEPFGYGLSDKTEEERTIQNITRELHECLTQLDIDKYILMGHSIFGVYSLEYINQYPNEVSAFIGIDTSVPEQIDQMMEIVKPSFALAKFLSKTGLIRISGKFNPEVFGFEGIDPETREQIHLLTLRNSMNKPISNEADLMPENFNYAKALHYPTQLPVLFFIVSEENTQLDNWRTLHEDRVKGLEHGEVIMLDGGHYLHHTQSPAIVKEMRRFLAEAKGE